MVHTYLAHSCTRASDLVVFFIHKVYLPPLCLSFNSKIQINKLNEGLQEEGIMLAMAQNHSHLSTPVSNPTFFSKKCP